MREPRGCYTLHARPYSMATKAVLSVVTAGMLPWALFFQHCSSYALVRNVSHMAIYHHVNHLLPVA